ncbi:MAG: hypothetical protein ACXWCG_01570 [Flavitalea sp.]
MERLNRHDLAFSILQQIPSFSSFQVEVMPRLILKYTIPFILFLLCQGLYKLDSPGI